MRRMLIMAALVVVDVAAYAGLMLAPARKAPAASDTPAPAVMLAPLRVYQGSGEPRGFVIYFSDADGWNRAADATASGLAAQGFAVAAVDSRAFLTALDRPGDACVHPVQPLMAMAERAEGKLGWGHYQKPILAGHGLGGTLAYAALAQAVPGIFTAGVSSGFADVLPGAKRWCSLNGYTATRVDQPQRGWRPGPATALPTPWRALDLGPAPAGGVIAPILAASPGARRITAPSEAQGILAAVQPLIGAGPGPGPTA